MPVAGYPKQAIAVLGSVEALESVLDRLEEADFDHDQISVLVRREVISGKLGREHSIIDAARLVGAGERDAPIRKIEMNELRAVMVSLPAYVGAVIAGTATVASGGVLLPIIVATAAGGAGGALFGGLLSLFLDARRADYFDRQLASGGIVLWILLDNAEWEKKALQILPAFATEPIAIQEPQAA
jgi:hypothetical protein